MSFLDYLFRRSPKNAATPNVQPAPPVASAQPGTGSSVRPLERNVEVSSIAGLLNELRRVETRYVGADGEVIHCLEAHGGFVLGCGHHGTAQAGAEEGTRGREIAGVCAYCVRDYQPLVDKGELDPLQAERLSLVCNECARMTTSGHLCCPRHSRKVTAEDGTTPVHRPDRLVWGRPRPCTR